MPNAMIAPMKDWMFRVVPVYSKIASTPQITAGAMAATAIAKRKDWKLPFLEDEL